MVQKVMKTQPEWPFSLCLFFIIFAPSHCNSDQKVRVIWKFLVTSKHFISTIIEGYTVKPGKRIDFLKLALVSKCLEVYRVPSITLPCVSLTQNLAFFPVIALHAHLEPCSSRHCSIFTYLILSSLSCLFPLLLIVVMIHIPTGWVGSCDSKLSPEKGFCSFPVTSVTCTERRCSRISRRSSSSNLRPKRNSLEKWANWFSTPGFCPKLYTEQHGILCWNSQLRRMHNGRSRKMDWVFNTR